MNIEQLITYTMSVIDVYFSSSSQIIVIRKYYLSIVFIISSNSIHVVLPAIQ